MSTWHNTTVPPPTSQEALLSDFTYILNNATRCATFTCGGHLPIQNNPGNLTPKTEAKLHSQRLLTKSVTLRWGSDGQGRTLTLPLADGDAEATTAFASLLQASSPATFGRSGHDVYDPAYRRALALSAGDFLTDFCPYEAGIVDLVAQLLLPPLTGDLKPEPPRSKLARKFQLSHAQEVEIEYTIDALAGNNLGLDVRDLEKCLVALKVGPESALEMLQVHGVLDPTGLGLVDREAFIEFAAERVRARWVRENPRVVDSRAKMVSRGLRAELYKLNVYSGPSGLFKPHVDTPRSEMQIGSLVVCLPVQFEGGSLVVRHQLEEVVYDWSANDGPCVQWAAFYSDCEHEVREVSAGHRVTLTYNLFLAPGTSMLAGKPNSLDRERLPLVTNLNMMLASGKFMPEGGYIGVHLAHCYPHTHEKLHQFVPSMLKGVDMVLYESVAVLGLSAIVCHVTRFDLPPHQGLAELDRMDKENARDASAETVANRLVPFEADFDLKEDGYVDEEDAFERAEEAFDFDTDSDDERALSDIPQDLREWKSRFDDRDRISWVNAAKHEEVSGAFMVVSLDLK